MVKLGRQRKGRASSSLLATIYSSSQSLPTMYQTGIRCPHHSCLLMHQSLIFDSQ
ncbi:hypothetical protein PRUPE_3G161800 [Prunus persica]|uniref:Uncharacterized protein n=1 Tax=Prunus persica TaxID=3760 RepID=A0A251Q0X5_PRUPE|nr:hypothetical protein PRUPE_3G161800 [Prunus persica]